VETTGIEIKTLAAAVIAVISVELTMGVINTYYTLHPLFLTGLARSMQIILMILIVSSQGQGLNPIGLSLNGFARGLQKGLLWSAGFGLATILVTLLFFLGGINLLNFFNNGFPTDPIAMLFIVGGFIGPIAEELFFRGLLFTYLRRWGMIPALLGSTGAFVLIHPVQGLAVTQIIGGLLFGISFEIEKNLMVPVTIHVFGNMAIFALPAIV
jgi:membrane protease YdiL (CAAX protease family)